MLVGLMSMTLRSKLSKFAMSIFEIRRPNTCKISSGGGFSIALLVGCGLGKGGAVIGQRVLGKCLTLSV